MCTSGQFMSLRGHFYLPPMKLQKGNVLQVSVCPQGGWGRCTPTGRYPLPRDGHCSGWYTSYWNAFLLHLFVCSQGERGYDITSCMVPCPSWGEVGQGLCLQGEFASREGDQVLAFWHKWHFGTSSRRTLMPEGQWPSVISTGLL